MTPPPGSPVNDFEDTHVMETRHPLTIPAAIVLGTAVVATALPVPSSTPATATGTAHVTRAYTDKSTHEPGKQATITAKTGRPSRASKPTSTPTSRTGTQHDAK